MKESLLFQVFYVQQPLLFIPFKNHDIYVYVFCFVSLLDRT